MVWKFDEPMTAWDVLRWVNKEKVFGLLSRDSPGREVIGKDEKGNDILGELRRASNSELRRWLDRKSVKINGEFPGPKEMISEVHELVIFAKSDKKRITIL